MSKKLLRLAAVVAALVLVFGLVPVAVFADDAAETTNETETNSTRGEELKSKLQELKQERQANRQQKLEANKLRVCENRKAKITAIMTRSVTRAEKQLGVFTKISDRVKAFYENKGRTVANYNDLVAAVDAAKAKAQANLDTIKDLEPFDCSADDPKGNIEAFKLALKSINQDLKDYKTSVRNLIVAVKSAQSTTAKQNQDQQKPEEGGEEQ